MTTPKKLSQTLTEFTTAVGQDIKALSQKDAQIEQELNTLKEQTASSLNEARVAELLNQAKAEVKNDLLNGVGAEYDTLKEIADYINTDKSTGVALATAMANRVRFDETQTLTTEQQKTAAANIGLGDITTDFLAIYNRAKA